MDIKIEYIDRAKTSLEEYKSYCLVEFYYSDTHRNKDFRCVTPKISCKAFRNYIAHSDEYKGLDILRVAYFMQANKGTRFWMIDCWSTYR